ncbi:LysR substrate-binding domain-containing protein [Burkholderia singularis]|uniref:Glycine cleavage system transcriptional activator n=1 Tax=Burkholderia singularis TaxID=1503053 RepID=A0A238H5T7_9BURK|nr:LysR substrate-binding domain-containing protein [Burkholderia singularis]SMG00679.1 Glycine cleavage system transcriptional activator [Burkholderia singularis]
MAVPLVKLPPLDLIRGFVAVGRRMSITVAAQDLCVTQSAVSRQINALETTLGVRLLNRGYRSISLTADGERLFRAADGAIQQLQEAVDALTHPTTRQPVTITASIGVAALWLLPRLGNLQRRHPDIDLRVAANDKILDARAEGIDLAIRYSPASSAPPASIRLFDESIMPVAHPSLGVHTLDAVALARHVLLEFDGPRRPLLRWSDHLSALGLDDAPTRGILRFNQYDQVIQAALAGSGIALGRRALVEPLLAEGRLVAIGEPGAGRASGHAYWLHQTEAVARDDVRAVVAWIMDEASAMADADVDADADPA